MASGNDVISQKQIDLMKNYIASLEEDKAIKKENKFIEFSKKMMFYILTTYFVHFIYGMLMSYVLKDSSVVNTLLLQNADIVKIAVGFYSIKAGTENVFKYWNKYKNINTDELQ